MVFSLINFPKLYHSQKSLKKIIINVDLIKHQHNGIHTSMYSRKYLDKTITSGGAHPTNKLPEAVSFSLVNTLLAIPTGDKAIVAVTAVGALSVAALAIFADVGVQGTLVDVPTVIRHAYL